MLSIRSLHHSLIQKRLLNTTTASSTLSPTSPLPNTSSCSSFTVQFLINSCGLPLQNALSASKNLQIHKNDLQKLQSVLQFLKSHDFNDAHVAKLVEKRPDVLLSSVENNLKPKFDFFLENGFVGQLLTDFIISNPAILKRPLDSQIKPSFELLKSFLNSNENILAAVKRDSWLFTTSLKRIVRPNLDFLIKEGVSADRVAKLLIMLPRTINRKHERVVYAVNTVKNLGIEPKSSYFIHAFRVMTQMSESTWNKKMEVMKSAGWSEEDVLWAFKRHPYCLAYSEERIRNVMDFLLNTVNLGLQTIIRQPILLMYAIDKRLQPRYNVFKVLQSKKLIEGNKKIEQLLKMTEKNFLENYVTKYADKVPGLLEIYGVTTKAKKINS